jgi:hypothetical protein
MAKKTKNQTKVDTKTTSTQPTTPTAPVATEVQPTPAPTTMTVAAQTTEAKVAETPKTEEAKRDNIKAAKSTVANPVQVVHKLVADMVASNPQVRRKDLVNAAIEAGCAYYTARTQVQVALKKMKTV